MGTIVEYFFDLPDGTTLKPRVPVHSDEELPEEGDFREVYVRNDCYRVQIKDIAKTTTIGKTDFYEASCEISPADGMQYRISVSISDGPKVHQISYDSAEIPAEKTLFYGRVNGLTKGLISNGEFGIRSKINGQTHVRIYAKFANEDY